MGNSCSCTPDGEGGDNTGGRRVTLVARVAAVHSHHGTRPTVKPLVTNTAVGVGSEADRLFSLPTSPNSELTSPYLQTEVRHATPANGNVPSTTRRRNLHPKPSPRLVPSAFHSVIPAIPTVPTAPHAADRQGPLLSLETSELHLLGGCPEELAKATLLALHLRSALHEVDEDEEDDPATGNPFMTAFQRRRAEARRLRREREQQLRRETDDDEMLRYVNPSMEPSLTNESHSTATCLGEEFSNDVDAFS